MSPPLNFTEALLDPLHSAIYIVFMLVACAIFSKTCKMRFEIMSLRLIWHSLCMMCFGSYNPLKPDFVVSNTVYAILKSSPESLLTKVASRDRSQWFCT